MFWNLEKEKIAVEFAMEKENCVYLKSPLTLENTGDMVSSLRRRRSKPSVYSVCELVHNIVFESRRVAKKYVGVIDWLFSFAVCD